MKRWDQRAAFVTGMALLFKLPFDLMQLYALRPSFSTDFQSDWLPIIVQSTICLACLQHYGLLKAGWVTLNNMWKKDNPTL